MGFLDGDTQNNNALEFLAEAKRKSKPIYQNMFQRVYQNCLLSQGKMPNVIARITSFLDNGSLNEIVGKI